MTTDLDELKGACEDNDILLRRIKYREGRLKVTQEKLHIKEKEAELLLEETKVTAIENSINKITKAVKKKMSAWDLVRLGQWEASDDKKD